MVKVPKFAGDADDLWEITFGEFRRFLAERGASIPKACTNCKSAIHLTSDNEVIAHASAKELQQFFTPLNIYCGNCGMVAAGYIVGPFLDWLGVKIEDEVINDDQ